LSKQLAQGHLPSRIVAWPKCKPRTARARPERQRV